MRRQGSQVSSRGEAKDSALLSSRDAPQRRRLALQAAVMRLELPHLVDVACEAVVQPSNLLAKEGELKLRDK